MRSRIYGKRSLTRHMKNQHGHLWSCQNDNFDNYETHQRTCLFKTTGKRSGEHLREGMTAKKLKGNVNRVAAFVFMDSQELIELKIYHSIEERMKK